MDIETKLSRFSDVVLKEAEELKKKQTSVMDKKYEDSMGDFEKKAKAKYAEMLNDATISAEKAKQKKISQKSAEIKKALIQKRGSYVERIFENVMERLLEFFKTPEYEAFIVDFIESYKPGSKPENMTAYIMVRDLGLKESIEKRTGVPVVATEEDFLGGVRLLLDGSRVADGTLKRKLASERAGFNKIRII